MAAFPAASADAVVTDPPYSLSFMGHEWDTFRPAEYEAWCEKWAAECLRVLKPGGHLLAFGGTRTYHRLACGIEDAGFEIRDSLHWIYGSGFPKSLDVSKAIDKAADAEREVRGRTRGGSGLSPGHLNVTGGSLVGGKSPQDGYAITAPATEDAARWEGWGTALKPAHEPIVVARKPLAGTVAANLLKYGTGALNIDGCRVAGEKVHTTRNTALGVMNDDGWQPKPGVFESHDNGRWPPNVLGPEAATELDRQSGVLAGCGGPKQTDSGDASMFGIGQPGRTYERQGGGASRFFPVFRYQAKASSRERPRLPDGTAHPTVKPVALMRWLVRLVTPPDGLVLDPFAGSGSTGEACELEGFRCVLIEKDPSSAELIRQRMSRPMQAEMLA